MNEGYRAWGELRRIKECWFGESKVLFWTQKLTLHPNKLPTFLLLYSITNEKTVKLMPIDRLLSASKTSPAETRSSNSGRYTQDVLS